MPDKHAWKRLAHVAVWAFIVYACPVAAGSALDNATADTRIRRTGGGAGIIIAGVDLVMEDAYLVTEPDGVVRVESPSAGQPVYFQGDWRTDGLGGPVGAALAGFIDGALFCQADLFIEPGESGIVYCNAPWIATSGPHTLRWEIDAFDAVDEADELNNSASVQFATLRTPTRTRKARFARSVV